MLPCSLTRRPLQVMDSVCKCYDVADEGVELLVLKFMLSAVTSTSVQVHGEMLC